MKTLTVGFSLCLAVSVALSSSGSEYFINPKTRIEIPISNSGVNRLVLANDRILKIVGSEDEYIVEGDSVRGHAFITSKLGSGEKSFATIISEKGLTQDVTFKIDGDSPPVAVLLKRAVLTQNRASKRNSIEASITSKIQSILSGNTRGFRQRHLSPNYFRKLPFKVNQAVEYLSPKYHYIWLDIGANELDAECINSVDISSFKDVSGVLAVARQNNNLILVRKG